MLTFWSSLDALNSIKEGIAALLVVLAVIGFFVDRRAGKLQDKADKESDEKIAIAVRDGEKAGLLAAEANERAAALTKQAEELRQKNIELEASLSPRWWMPRPGAVDALREFGPTRVVIRLQNESEALHFAGQLKLHLGKGNGPGSAGWDCVLVEVTALELQDVGRGAAIYANVPSADTSTEALLKRRLVDVLIHELAQSGVVAEEGQIPENSGDPPGAIVIKIGPRPDPETRQKYLTSEPTIWEIKERGWKAIQATIENRKREGRDDVPWKTPRTNGGKLPSRE